MAVDERARHGLITRLVETLGDEAAATLMSYLPPVGWADVATKRDLDALAERLELRTETLLIRHRADTQLQISELRDEMHQQIGGLRGEMHQQIGGLRDDLRRQTLLIVFSVVGAVVAVGGLGIATG